MTFISVYFWLSIYAHHNHLLLRKHKTECSRSVLPVQAFHLCLNDETKMVVSKIISALTAVCVCVCVFLFLPLSLCWSSKILSFPGLILLTSKQISELFCQHSLQQREIQKDSVFSVGSYTTHSSCYQYNNCPSVSGRKAVHIGVIHSVSLLRELMDYSNYFSHLCFHSAPWCPVLMLINAVPENCKWCEWKQQERGCNCITSWCSDQIRLYFWHKKQTVVLRKKIIEFARKAEWNILITIFPSVFWLLSV